MKRENMCQLCFAMYMLGYQKLVIPGRMPQTVNQSAIHIGLFKSLFCATFRNDIV